ncbi:MAG TPA: SAM-dependent chlorinase/fluorinase, partial [Acidimicrobiia bacterium]|nr:SAM-dependent chlorinase/fluorinase [Acidimicrobiia bacterium]
MLGLAPGLTIIDVTHEVPPHDVRAGALTLVRAVQYLPDGSVVLAVVDPGVGTDRRLLAVACERATFVGPDNGLLAPAVALLGGADTVVSLTRADQQLPAPGPTFAGRDILAPATAHLALEGPLTDLGDPVDPASLLPGLVG